MRFVSNGDFLMPLGFPTYWAQHVYIWSYERGAANPDGILRLPGRLVDIAVFALVGNVGFGYFYLASCLLIAFLAFLWFARSFLEATRWGTAVLGALFFACNPIFLGNLSKVGLILAAAMLPLALTALKQGFAKKRYSYFLLYIAALTVSLLHPFTFAVNAIASGAYALFLARKHAVFVRDNAWKFGLLAITALLLNAYCLLPLASLRTLDKGALSDTVTATPVDYRGLVDIANTGDIFTGLSLSKAVLKDYEFYGPTTWPFYFLGTFMFYALLFGVYVRVEKRAKPAERRRFVLALGLFLVLVVLATASYLYAGVLIKLLIGLPGGWMFRSPLKWQLYMPLTLFIALVIALKYVRDGWRLKVLYAAFGLSFVLMNSYLCKEIYQRLLTPRSLAHFSALQQTDMRHKNLLFADSGTCATFARDNPGLATELNQVLISKTAQIKHVQAGNINGVNLAQYDFVMGCTNTLDDALLTKQYAFTPAAAFVDGTYRLYKNTRPAPYVGAAGQLFSLEEPKNLGGKYALAQTLGRPFNFVAGAQNDLPRAGLQDVFDSLAPGSMQDGSIHSSVRTIISGRQQLFIKGGQPVFFTHSGGRLQLSAVQEAGMQPALSPLSLDTNKLDVTYRDPKFSYQNLIPNASIEQGLWQKKVGDCNAYDDKPSLAMSLQKRSKTNGAQSLELTARAHIACTGPNQVAVQAGEHYLLGFDYQSQGGPHAGYFAGFDNLEATSTGARLPNSKGAWQSFSAEIVAPEGAEHLQLMVYAYPDNSPGGTGLARYDNFTLTRIPDITNRFFVMSKQSSSTASAPRVEFTKTSPTKTIIRITNASAPFYLTTKESYHHQWQLRSGQTVLPNHLRINGAMNGWYVEPAAESHDMLLVMEFAPQHWFFVGLIISTATAMGAMSFVTYEFWRRRPEKERRR